MITIPRLQGALEGFFAQHRHWPTRVCIEPEVLMNHYRMAFDGGYSREDRKLLAQVSFRIQFVGRTGAQYLAEDEAGNRYDYGQGGFPNDMPSGMLLQAWLGGQSSELV